MYNLVTVQYKNYNASGVPKKVRCTYIMHDGYNTSTLFLDPKHRYMERKRSERVVNNIGTSSRTASK